VFEKHCQAIVCIRAIFIMMRANVTRSVLQRILQQQAESVLVREASHMFLFPIS